MVLATGLGHAQGAPDVVAPVAIDARSSTTRQGLRLVHVPAPESPWTVVQLHVRAAGEGLSAEEQALVTPLAHALAEGTLPGSRFPSARARVAEVGGTTRVHVDVDGFVISDGVPKERLDTALAAMAHRLRVRRALAPAPEALPALPDASELPLVVRQLLAPGHAYARPLAPEGPPDAARLRALADRVLRRDGVVVSIVAPEDPAALDRGVARYLTVPLPAGVERAAPFSVPEGTRLAEGVSLTSAPKGAFSWLWLPAPGLLALEDASAEEAARALRQRAVRAVLARLVGAEVGERSALAWLSIALKTPAPEKAGDTEDAFLARLEALAKTPPDAARVRAAAKKERAERLFLLKDPERLALATGRAALFAKDPRRLAESLDALEGIGPADVREAAGDLLDGPRSIVRGEGVSDAPVPADATDATSATDRTNETGKTDETKEGR